MKARALSKTRASDMLKATTVLRAKERRKNWCAGEVSTHSDATQANPTFSREDLGAVLSDAKIGRILETTKVSSSYLVPTAIS